MIVWSWAGWFPPETKQREKDTGALSRPCPDCGLPHTPERRQAVLRRMLPATTADITEQWSHLWPADESGAPRQLFRDLRAIGAKRPADQGGLWRIDSTKAVA